MTADSALIEASFANINSQITANKLSVKAQSTLDIGQKANLQSTGNTTLNAQSLTQKGQLISNGGITLDANTLTHEGETSANQIVVNAESLEQSGQLIAEQDISIAAKSATLSGQTQANQNLKVTGETINAKGALEATQLSLSSSSSVNIDSAAQVSAIEQLSINTSDLSNKGSTYSGGALTIDVNTLDQQGTLTSVGDLKIDTSTLDIQRNIETQGNLDLSASSVTNSAQVIADQDLNLSAQSLSNNGTLTASGDTSISLSNNFTHGSSGVISGRNVTLSAVQLDNSGTLQALDSLNLTVSSLVNKGGLVALGDLTASVSGGFNNQSLIYVGNNANLYSNTLHNTSDIVVGHDLLIAKNAAKQRGASVTNSSGTIESLGGDIGIYTNTLTNKRSILEIENTAKIDKRAYFTPRFIANGTPYEPDHRVTSEHRQNSREHNNRTVYTHYIVSGREFSAAALREGLQLKRSSEAGNIKAQGGLHISASEVENNSSQIAARDINLTADKLTNRGYTFYEYTTYYDYSLTGRGSSSSGSWGDYVFKRDAVRKVKTGSSGQLHSSITASNNLTLNVANKVNNSTLKANATAVQPTKSASELKATSSASVTGPEINFNSPNNVAFPDFVFPSTPNGLFVVSPDPQGKYLIETNPLLTNMGSFLGSDYFMSSVGFNPEADVKFLGDAFYDSRIISQAIFEQTGQQYLSASVGSQLEQMQQLIDAAATQKAILNLTAGIALSPEQVANLNQDILWYEEIEVNGQRVLAPKLYLAQATIDNLVSGAQIAGSNVNIDAGDLENSGHLAANKNLSVNSANSITNIGGTIASSGGLSLSAEKDITNLSGDIKGHDVSLEATNGNIINDTRVTTSTASLGNNRGTFTDVGKTAAITSTGNLTLIAGKNIENHAADIKANGDANLNAGQDIIVRSKEETHGHDVTARRWKEGASEISQIAANVTAGGNLNVNAGQDIKITASQIESSEALSLTAGNDVSVSTALNKQSDHNYRSNYTEINRNTQHQGSSLTGSNIAIRSGNKVNVSGSTVSASDSVDISAKGDVNILAVNDSQYHFDKTVTKKSFGRKKTTINEIYKETVKGSSIQAGDRITIKAQNLDTAITAGGESDINIIGSELNAGGEVELSADGDVNLAAQTFKEFERHETIKKGFGGLSGRNKGSLEDATLLNSSYVINSGNTTVTAGRDIGVIASEVSSGGDVNLNAVNDVLIAAGDVLKQAQQWDEKTSFLSGGNLFEMEKKRRGEQTSTAQASQVQSGGNLAVEAGSIKVVGSELNANNNVDLVADTGDVEILAAKETTKTTSSEEKLSIRLGDGFKGVSVEDGQLKISLGDASYDKVKEKSDALNHQGSQIVAGDHLTMEAESSILVEGSNLVADNNQDQMGDLTLAAKDNVTIKEAVDTLSEQREEIHGKAEVSLVVQHQAVEVAKAAQALQKSTKKLKQAEQDYKQYKKGLDSLESTLGALEQEYADKKPGVTFEDIEELNDLISEVKSDEAWYVAGVTLAAEDVASKTTLLYQQADAAYNSAGTYGFNAGLHLDIEATKTKENSTQTTSVGSTLSGQNIAINAGNKAGNKLAIQGSELAANDSLALTASEVNITASQDTNSHQSATQSGKVDASLTVYGASTGINLNASYDRSQSNSASITHKNSQLNADNITITSNQDTNIKGATVAANDSLLVDVGGDLNVASVQDRHSSSNKGMGISGGLSLSGGTTAKDGGVVTSIQGAGDLTGSSAGVNASNGRTRTKQTVLTSLTSGGSADISVANNTDVKGALIATTDENGQDSGELNLTTGSLTFADLSNTSYNQNRSMGLNTSVGVNDGELDSTNNSTSVQYKNTSGYSKSKTLATIGQGNLTIVDSENSDDTSSLNRATEHTEKDLFTVDRKQGDFDVTVDHRLLTEKGRNQIAEDILITDMFRESLERAITTERVGITDFFDETGKQLNVYNAVKQSIADDPSLATKLQDPDLPSETKEQMLDQLTHAAIQSLGYDAEGYGNKIIAKEEDVRQGFHSEETGDSYINDAKIDDTEGLVLTAGHEMSHFVDGQTGDNEKYSKQDQETYAENIGEDFVDYTDTALGVNGHANMASNNNHVGNTSSSVVNNTHEYNRSDKSKGDNLIFAVPVVYEVGMAVTAATAAYLQANPDVAASIYDTLSESAENAGRTLNEMLTVDPKLTDKELDVQAVVVSGLLKDLEDHSRSTEDKLEIYRLIDEYDPKAVELAKERAKAISPNTGGSKIVENNNTTYTNPIDEGYDSSTVTEVGGSIDASTETVVTTEQGLGSTESPAESGVEPLLVYLAEKNSESELSTGKIKVDTNNSKQRGTQDYDFVNNPKPNTTYELDNGTTFHTGGGGMSMNLLINLLIVQGNEIHDKQQWVKKELKEMLEVMLKRADMAVRVIDSTYFLKTLTSIVVLTKSGRMR